MNTSQETPFSLDNASDQKIPVGKLAYFRQRLRNRFYKLVVAEFLKLEEGEKLTKAEVTRRIDRRPEQVTRWLASPGNWTLDTISDLMLAMGAEPELGVSYIKEQPTRNYDGPDWLTANYQWVEKNQRRLNIGTLAQNDAQAISAGLPVQAQAAE